MIHEFSKSLTHERNQTEKADNYYKTILGAVDIERYNSDSKSDMEMQRADIDLRLTIRGTRFAISEKFRDKDFGDLYIEVFSKYPHKPGWMHTGKPDAIIYFTPQSTYWITHKSLKEFYSKVLYPSIPDEWYKFIYDSKQSVISKKVELNNFIADIKLIQAHNHDGNSWETIGVALKFDILEKFGVKFRKY